MSSRCHHIPWIAIVRHSGAKEEDLKDHFFRAVKWLAFFLAYLCFTHFVEELKKASASVWWS